MLQNECFLKDTKHLHKPYSTIRKIYLHAINLRHFGIPEKANKHKIQQYFPSVCESVFLLISCIHTLSLD